MGDRHVAADEIDQPAGDEERRNASRPLFVQRHRSVIRCRRGRRCPSRSSRRSRSGPRRSSAPSGRRAAPAPPPRMPIDDEIVDLALFLGLHPVVGIEGRPRRRRAAPARRSDRRCRKHRNFRRARRRDSPASRRRQVGLDAAGQRRNHAETRDDDADSLPLPISFLPSDSERNKGRTFPALNSLRARTRRRRSPSLAARTPFREISPRRRR